MPAAFSKVLVSRGTSGDYAVAAYLMPNERDEDTPGRLSHPLGRGDDFEVFRVSLSSLETEAGPTFSPALHNAEALDLGRDGSP